MWYASRMPEVLPKREIANADAAVAFAQQVRKLHRRATKRGDKRREDDLEIALLRIRDAMRPLRSAIGRFPYGPQTEIAETNRLAIRAASARLQRERRKLFKMQAH